jgi:hypothetical protein
MYILFGSFNYLVYGSELSQAPLITKLLPQDSPFVAITELIYMFNLIVSFPLVIHPTNMIVEGYIFKHMNFSMRRKWLKNISRTVIVGLVIFTGLYL